MHETTGRDDAADPDPKGRLAAELRQVLEHRHQAVLEEVFGGRAVSHQPTGQRKDGRRERQIDLGLRSSLSPGGTRQGLGINLDVGKAAH